LRLAIVLLVWQEIIWLQNWKTRWVWRRFAPGHCTARLARDYLAAFSETS